MSIFQKSQKNSPILLRVKFIKTGNTASVLIQFQTLVVKTLLKHKINKVLYCFVKKEVFEQLKFNHSESIAFHKN